MAARRFEGTLTDLEVLALVDDGAYAVDLETGDVRNRDGKRPHITLGGDPKRYFYVRIYRGRRRRASPVAHLVWIVGNRRAVPDGFEVHHRDTDVTHNAFRNLYCLSDVDHDKLHEMDLLASGAAAPF